MLRWILWLRPAVINWWCLAWLRVDVGTCQVPGSASLVATCIEKAEVQRGKVSHPRAHSKFIVDTTFKPRLQSSFHPLSTLSWVEPRNPQWKPAQGWGRQRKMAKGRVKGVGGTSLSWDGTMEPWRDPSLGQLVHLCLHEPVQSWGQWWGQLSGLCHGLLGRKVSPGGTKRRESSLVRLPFLSCFCSSWRLFFWEALQAGQSNRFKLA